MTLADSLAAQFVVPVLRCPDVEDAVATATALHAASAVTDDDLGTYSRRMGGRSGVRHPDAGETATGDELYRRYLRNVDAELVRRVARGVTRGNGGGKCRSPRTAGRGPGELDAGTCRGAAGW
jgi:hypothetical protein